MQIFLCSVIDHVLCSISQMYVYTKATSISKVRAGVTAVITSVDVLTQRRVSTNVMMCMFFYLGHSVTISDKYLKNSKKKQTSNKTL